MKVQTGLQVSSQTSKMDTVTLHSDGLQSCISGPGYDCSPTEHRKPTLHKSSSTLSLPNHCIRHQKTNYNSPKYFIFFLFRATPTVCGGSQARGLIGSTAAGLHHSHSNIRSKPHMQPTPQLRATPDP